MRLVIFMHDGSTEGGRSNWLGKGSLPRPGVAKGVYHALAWQRETNAIILKSFQSKRMVNRKSLQKSEKSGNQINQRYRQWGSFEEPVSNPCHPI